MNFYSEELQLHEIEVGMCVCVCVCVCEGGERGWKWLLFSFRKSVLIQRPTKECVCRMKWCWIFMAWSWRTSQQVCVSSVSILYLIHAEFLKIMHC